MKRLIGLILILVLGLIAVVLLAGCTRPARYVGSTSMTVDELERRNAEAYPPDLERAEWGQ